MNSQGSKNNQTKSPCLRIIPLGGLGEIGKNTCVFEYGDDIMILDAGLAFPTDGMHGVNVVMPDTTYLRENQNRIRGLVVTHGHEDHIGGISHHLKNFNIPIVYGPPLAMSMLRGKMEEAGVADRTTIQVCGPREVIKVGQHFSVEFVRNTHSISDSFSFAVTTPVGVVFFTGDFKFDHTPPDGQPSDLARMAHYGDKGVLCLLSDSTNSEVTGFTPSEYSVFPNLDRYIATAEGRVMVTTFASSTHRVAMLLELAMKNGRKVGLLGRSMLNVVGKARELGYKSLASHIKKTGPLTMPPSQLGAFAKSDPSQPSANIEWHVQPLSLDKFGSPLHRYNAITPSVCNLRPSSRGTVSLKSANPHDAPAIAPNYLSTQEDRDVAVAGLRFTRDIMAAPALAPFNPRELKPGPQITTEDELHRAAGYLGTTIFLPVGT